MSLTHTAPEVAPSEVSGGGGSRSELVITWDVSVWAASFPSGYCFSSNYHILLQYTDVDCDGDSGGSGGHGSDGDTTFASGSNI